MGDYYYASDGQAMWNEVIAGAEQRRGEFAGIMKIVRKKQAAKIALQKRYYICIDCGGIGRPDCERCKGSGRYDYTNNHPLPRRRR